MQQGDALTTCVSHAVAGDQDAFMQLVLGSQGTLYSAAKAILHSEQDALDAVQDAILIAWQKLHTLKNHAYFTTWLTRIVIRTAIDLRRKRKPLQLKIDVTQAQPSYDEIMDIRYAMNSLDEKTRLCAVLYYYEGMSVREIARAIGIREGTVKSRLHRARIILRSALEVWEDE